MESFNEEARQAILWTRTVLKPEHKVFLNALEYNIHTEFYQLVHGSPRDPLDEYLLDVDTFEKNLEDLKANICFVGHTHLPLFFYREKETNKLNSRTIAEGEELALDRTTAQIINPGSVGQPRDGDKRASFGVFDTGTLKFKLMRKEYNIGIIQEEMKKAGLPEPLISRLSEGR